MLCECYIVARRPFSFLQLQLQLATHLADVSVYSTALIVVIRSIRCFMLCHAWRRLFFDEVELQYSLRFGQSTNISHCIGPFCVSHNLLNHAEVVRCTDR